MFWRTSSNDCFCLFLIILSIRKYNPDTSYAGCVKSAFSMKIHLCLFVVLNFNCSTPLHFLTFIYISIEARQLLISSYTTYSALFYLIFNCKFSAPLSTCYIWYRYFCRFYFAFIYFFRFFYLFVDIVSHLSHYIFLADFD